MTNRTALIILQQLGGNRFLAMTGAKNLVSLDAGQDSGGSYAGGLMFSIASGARNKANKVCVKLADNDLYRVEFFTIRGVNVTARGTFENVYADGLAALFTEQTGFDTHL
jgi:hypothetical protein